MRRRPPAPVPCAAWRAIAWAGSTLKAKRGRLVALRNRSLSAIYCKRAWRSPMSEGFQNLAEKVPTGNRRLALEGFFGIMEHWGADNAVARRILGSPAER